MQSINIEKIPNNAGVYLFKDRKGTILYIGKAKNLQKRLGQYFSINSLRKQEMLQKADKVDFLIVKNESEALYLEDNMIKKHQPFYNNLLKADNSYVYIKITKESFPQIFLTRKKINDNALYIGPKRDTIQLKKFLQYIRQILKFRGCKTTQFKQGKLCSDYYFGLCRGWCKLTKNLSVRRGNEGEVDYKNIIHTITSFFKGNTKPIEQEIHKQIELAIIHENFEWAAQLRDIYQSIQGFVEKQNVVLPERKDGYLALVKNIGSQYIYTVLVFTQGKLMDIITSKEQHSDIDEDSLNLAIQRAFSEGNTYKTKNEIIIDGLHKKLKTPLTSLIKEGDHKVVEDWGETKRGLKPLLHLAENFLESYIISQSLQEESTIINDLFKTLQARYGLKNIPYRIECIDISHLSGGWTSGGLSCLVAGLPYKKGYRKYKIKAKKSDDYEALQELLERRFRQYLESGDNHLESSSNYLPSCLIIDGGKGQLGVVKKLCKENPKRKKIVSQIDIISLGKGEARTKSQIGKKSEKSNKKMLHASSIMHHASDMKGSIVSEKIYYFDNKLNIHNQAMVYDQADKIFLKARNEAHRFANTYRKKQMSKERKSITQMQ
ncbi:MAG: excinuclease ABC subunit UvrC [Candidatus Absconditabacterales bacterium]